MSTHRIQYVGNGEIPRQFNTKTSRQETYISPYTSLSGFFMRRQLIHRSSCAIRAFGHTGRVERNLARTCGQSCVGQDLTGRYPHCYVRPSSSVFWTSWRAIRGVWKPHWLRRLKGFFTFLLFFVGGMCSYFTASRKGLKV